MSSNTTATTEGSLLKGCAPTSPYRKQPGELSGNTRPITKEMSKLLSQRRQLMSLHNKVRAKTNRASSMPWAQVLADDKESFEKINMLSNKDNDMGNAISRHVHDALHGFEVADDVASESPIKSPVSKKSADLEVDDIASKSPSSLHNKATRENQEQEQSPIAFFQHYGIGNGSDATSDEVKNDVPDGSPYYVIVDNATNGVETQRKVSFTPSMPSARETRSGLTECTSTEGIVSESPKNVPAHTAEAPKQPSVNIFRRFFCAVDDVGPLKLTDDLYPTPTNSNSGEMIANQSTSFSHESRSIASASVNVKVPSYRGGVGCSSSGEESIFSSEEEYMHQTTFDSSFGFVETPFL